MAVPRWIVLDDTDPAVQYTDTWSLDVSGSQNNIGNYGPPYQNTLHRTNQSASFSFSFSGSQFIVYGTNLPGVTISGEPDPSCECFIDGVGTGTNPPSARQTNSWEFCSGQIDDGPHVLTVNVTVMSQPFWFDQIRYVPSVSVPLDNKAILIDNMDPQLVQNSYSPGWIALGIVSNQTGQTNTSFTFEFIGKSVSWFGRSVVTKLPQPSFGSATYAIDNNISEIFPIEGLPETGLEVFNVKLFQTPNLTQGNHNMTVLFEGDPATSPLTIDYLIVQNGSTPNSTSSIPFSSSIIAPTAVSWPPSTNTTAAFNHQAIQNSRKDPTAIIASSVGAIILTLTTIIIAYFMYQRRRKRRIMTSTEDFLSPGLMNQRIEDQLITAFPISQPETFQYKRSSTTGKKTDQCDMVEHHSLSSVPSYTSYASRGRLSLREGGGARDSDPFQQVVEMPPEYTIY